MSRIVGIGANVCDTLITIPHYPAEDTKLRASTVVQSGGGPCATGLVAAAKLGADCAYIGTITDDSAGVFLMEDLKKYGVSTEFVTIESGYTSFSSYIWLSEGSASRTCVFHKGDIPERGLNQEQKNAVKSAQLLMIDGNDMKAAYESVQLAHENGVKVLYDAGGLYDGVEKLLSYADIMIPSEEFALGHTGLQDAERAAKALYEEYTPDVAVITQGSRGGIIYDGKSIRRYPAFCVKAVDTNGSGDVFHGAFAYAVVNGFDYYKACIFSSAVSALKCTKIGARNAVPSIIEVESFLKERNKDGFKEIME